MGKKNKKASSNAKKAKAAALEASTPTTPEADSSPTLPDSTVVEDVVREDDNNDCLAEEEVLGSGSSARRQLEPTNGDELQEGSNPSDMEAVTAVQDESRPASPSPRIEQDGTAAHIPEENLGEQSPTVGEGKEEEEELIAEQINGLKDEGAEQAENTTIHEAADSSTQKANRKSPQSTVDDRDPDDALEPVANEPLVGQDGGEADLTEILLQHEPAPTITDTSIDESAPSPAELEDSTSESLADTVAGITTESQAGQEADMTEVSIQDEPVITPVESPTQETSVAAPDLDIPAQVSQRSKSEATDVEEGEEEAIAEQLVSPLPPANQRLGDHSPLRTQPRTPSPKFSRDGNEAGPSRLSPMSPPPISKDSSPRPPSISPHKDPRPLSFFAPKPSIPASAPIIVTDEDTSAVDDSAPFESVPLQTTPPQSATLPSSPRLHPASPSSNKRRSWNGFGVGKSPEKPAMHQGLNGHIDPVDLQSRSSISTIPPPQSSSNQATPEIGSDNASAEKQDEPRLHAPPAHPHPYPLPSPNSPPPTHTKRPSHSQSAGLGPNTSAGLGVKGVSTFEKVISHTRPSWLPPKDRAEDETHYHQWEEMMSKAREAEKDRRKIEEAKRQERDKRLAINTPKWEEMLDEKTFDADKIRKDPSLRKIWFEGAPTYLRGKAWSLAIGNPLALSKDLYKSCVARSKKAIDNGRFPPEILERIEKDLDETLVNLHLFQHGSPLRADLHELICAWVVYRSDTAMGYAPHINLLAAFFLLNSPPATAFLSLVNLLARPCLRAFFTETTDEIDAFYRVFENLQADMFPKIFANCKNLGLKVPESWFRSVLTEQVPFEAACRLLDQIALDGDGYIFRAALAIFGFLEPRLYFPDRDEIESVLEGRNHATQAIVERERERARLRGETYLEELDGKLSVFGLNEQALFDWLAEDGWKEARFERLVTREMPD